MQKLTLFPGASCKESYALCQRPLRRRCGLPTPTPTPPTSQAPREKMRPIPDYGLSLDDMRKRCQVEPLLMHHISHGVRLSRARP